MDNRLKKRLVAFVIFFIFVALAIIALMTSYPKLYATETYYPKGSFASLIGDNIYSLNGEVFLKRNIHDNKTTVLSMSSPVQDIYNAYWTGDKGVFLQLNPALLDSTIAGQILREQNITSDERAKYYIWYFDFSSNTLSLVSHTTTETDTIAYNDSNETLYFSSPVNNEVDGPVLREIFSASPKNIKPVKLITMPESGDISLFKCSVSPICFTSINPSDQSVTLWKIVNNKPDKIIMENKPFSSLAQSSSQLLYAMKTLDGEKNNDVIKATEAYIVDISTSSSNSTRTGALGSNISVQGNINHKPYVVFDDGMYIIGSTNLIGLMSYKLDSLHNFKPTDTIATDFTARPSANPEGETMYLGKSGNYILITPRKDILSNIPPTRPKVESTYKECFDQYSTYSDYTDELRMFRVGGVYDSSFDSRKKSFFKCISEKDSYILNYYNFRYVGLSPRDGRFVTE